MQHIVSNNEILLHQIEDENGAECKCLPDVRLNHLSGDMFVVHKSFNKEFSITEEELQAIFSLSANDPDYEGGNIYLDEAEEDEK